MAYSVQLPLINTLTRKMRVASTCWVVGRWHKQISDEGGYMDGSKLYTTILISVTIHEIYVT